MKKLISNLLALVLIFSITACGSENKTEDINILEMSAEIEEMMKTSEEMETPKTSGVSGNRDVSGFDIKTNQTINWYGIEFSFPSYFNVLKEDSTDTWMTYYPEEEDYYASLMFQSYESSGTQEFFNLSIPSIVKSTLGGGPLVNAGIQKSEEIIITGLPGWTITFSITDPDGLISTGIYSFVYNINTKNIIMITCVYDSKDQ